jgi:hypothetical protein
MRRPVPATAPGPLRTLAALILVDGRYLTSTQIALSVYPWPCNPQTVWSHWIPALRRSGCRIEHSYRYGYRLLEIPPDALLDDVLVVARALRQEQPTRLWSLYGRTVITPSQTRTSRLSA